MLYKVVEKCQSCSSILINTYTCVVTWGKVLTYMSSLENSSNEMKKESTVLKSPRVRAGVTTTQYTHYLLCGIVPWANHQTTALSGTSVNNLQKTKTKETVTSLFCTHRNQETNGLLQLTSITSIISCLCPIAQLILLLFPVPRST